MNESLRKVYDAIKAHHAEKGYGPSIRFICGRTGILSTATVHTKINKLKTLGFIKGDIGIPRSLTINTEMDIPV